MKMFYAFYVFSASCRFFLEVGWITLKSIYLAIPFDEPYPVPWLTAVEAATALFDARVLVYPAVIWFIICFQYGMDHMSSYANPLEVGASTPQAIPSRSNYNTMAVRRLSSGRAILSCHGVFFNMPPKNIRVSKQPPTSHGVYSLTLIPLVIGFSCVCFFFDEIRNNN